MVPAAGPRLSNADQRRPSIVRRGECEVGTEKVTAASSAGAPLNRCRLPENGACPYLPFATRNCSELLPEL